MLVRLEREKKSLPGKNLKYMNYQKVVEHKRESI